MAVVPAHPDRVAIAHVASAAQKADVPREAARPLKGIPEGVESAAAAGLRWVSDSAPGFTRRRDHGKFSYRDKKGRPLAAEARRRVKALAIPPAWSEVWICRQVNGHLQATGRDDRGRKQYIYHPAWNVARDEIKYGRMMEFGRALPAMRQAVRADLRRHGLPRERVLASIVELLDSTAIRIGNDSYARENKSFGLTTLRHRHVKISGGTVRFLFTGKGGKRHLVACSNQRVVKLLRRCQDLPGQRLFQYVDDDGAARLVHAEDINAYLGAIGGESFTAKDFRTWMASVLAAGIFARMDQPTGASEGKRQIGAMLEEVSAALGNTPAICRKSYVHPAVVASHLGGSLAEIWSANQGRWASGGRDSRERLFLALLKRERKLAKASSVTGSTAKARRS